MGLKKARCKDIINEIGDIVSKFSMFAEQVGIKDKTVAYIQSVLDSNMVSV